MVARWSQEDPSLPGVVQYLIDMGNEQWRATIALPPSTQTSDWGPGPFSTLYLVDGWLTFVVASQLAQSLLRFSLGQLAPVVVVGVSPAVDDPGQLTGRHVRDLTPTAVMPEHLKARSAEGAGGAPHTLDMLVTEIAPYLESIYPLDPSDRGLGGVSLGGMFTCWALLTQPEHFRRYLAISPSVYWDDELLLDATRLPGVPLDGQDVYLAVGALETGPDTQWPTVSPQMRAAASGIDLVAGMTRLEDRLRVAGGARIQADVIPGEQHATVWPAALTRGLVHLYRVDIAPRRPLP